MDYDDEQNEAEETTETGSDELLSDDNLRLPESASILVRLHAVRAWLARRRREVSLEIGATALRLQEMMQDEPQGRRLRRREREQGMMVRVQQAQQALAQAQERMEAYEEAEAMLEECITHTTTGERALVEYYLSLENLMQGYRAVEVDDSRPASPWYEAMADVLRRVEHVGIPAEE